MEEFSFNAQKYSSDEINLRLIFPEDVWLPIFIKLKDSSDYHSIDAASPYFHQLLLPLRTRILFPEVIKLCIDSMVFRNLADYSLLNCRYACKAWKQGVDAAFHQIVSETGEDAYEWIRFACPLHILNMNQDSVMWQLDVHLESKMDRFLEYFYNSHFVTGSNPFPARSIAIEIGDDLSIHNKVFDILQIYGHHVWHCCIRLLKKDLLEQPRQLLFFCKIVSLLTNLQTLRIHNITRSWNANTEDLTRVLTANPIPKLKNLKLLSCHVIGRPVFSQLIQNNPHIKKLRIEKLDLSKNSALLSTKLPSLEELHIFSLDNVGDFSTLISAQVQWPLKKLTLFCPCSAPHVHSVLCMIQERWAETLTEFNLIIPSSVSVSEMESSLKFPNLRTLRIETWFYVCLDFILHLSKSLVSLSVYHSGKDEYNRSLEKNSKIEFFTHMKNLGKSNIWKFFPKLREIKYADYSVHGLSAGRTYRRDHWVGYGPE